MDFWIDFAITALLRILTDQRKARPYYKALAKVYVKIRDLADRDPLLVAEIEHQIAKTGGT